jgi:UDP-3-O-[3-hydroxymyristoyl] glucosamine N-acyltransferase
MTTRLPEPIRLDALAARVDGRIRDGDPAHMLLGLASLARAGPDDVSFVVSRVRRAQVAATRAGALLVDDTSSDLVPGTAATILVADPYVAYAAVARWVAQARAVRDAPPVGVHPGAVVHPSARLAADVRIDAFCSIGPGAWIGAGAELGPGCVLGRDVRIGTGTRLAAGVTFYAGCEIGQHGIVHAGTVVGADGFGFAPEAGQWVKIPQLGRVLIGDDVEIGANCTIDRGALDDTLIAHGCKLDNLIQIGHNVRIGEHTAIAGCVGIAGSAVIGRRCRIGGKAGILGHLEICDDVTVSAMSLVTKSIDRPGFYSGVFPLMDNGDWERAAATLKRLPELRHRLRQLERHTGKR